MERFRFVFVWLNVFLIICSATVRAQDKQVSFPTGQITLKEVIRLIEEQTTYTVAYNHTE